MPLPNAPTPPTFNSSVAIFPSDLLGNDVTVQGGPGGITANNFTVAPGPGGQSNASGGFYTQISVTDASNILTGAVGGGIGSGGFANPQSGTSIYLPLPFNIEDCILQVWNDLSVFDYLPTIDKVVNAGIRGLGYTQAVNPFMFMLYKQPLFRVFEFKWILAPNNQQESTILMHIINYLKTASMPDYNAAAGNLLLTYPYIALPKLNPNQFLFDIKPCAIEAVQTDYSGSTAGPSFFRDGAPTMVALTIRLKEVDIMVRTDMTMAGRGGQLTNGMGAAATPAVTATSSPINQAALQGALAGLGGQNV